MSTVTKILRKTIENNNLAIKEIQAKVEALSQETAEYLKDNIECLKYIQDNCTHPSSTRKLGTYMSGGYDHVSEQEYTVECTECGKVLESRNIRGTYA